MQWNWKAVDGGGQTELVHYKRFFQTVSASSNTWGKEALQRGIANICNLTSRITGPQQWFINCSWTKLFSESTQDSCLINKSKNKETKFLMFVGSKKLQETVEFLQCQEPHKFHLAESEILEISLQVKLQSKLGRLYPFLHEDIFCLGSRLAQVDVPHKTLYPRPIPERRELARLVILNAHYSTLHGGDTQIICQMRTRFWIPGRRNQVRKLILNCVTCSRFRNERTTANGTLV